MTRLSKKQRKRLLLEHRYPKDCHDPDHRDYKNDKKTGEMVRIDDFYPLCSVGGYTMYPYYQCSVCGKRYHRAPAIC